MTETPTLGQHIHTVEGVRTDRPCVRPNVHRGPLDVYENAARWRCCGQTIELKPLPAPPREPKRHRTT